MEELWAIYKIKTYNGFRLAIDFDEGDPLYGEIIEDHLTYEEAVKKVEKKAKELGVSSQYYLANKWKRVLVLVENSLLKPHIPETKLYNQENLADLINRYPILFAKPIVGTGGLGIIKVTKLADRIIIKTAEITKVVKNLTELLNVLEDIIGESSYLIQQGISLITIQNRPLDFRVLLLKPKDEWDFMGIMGKWGARNKIVTNHSRGGEPITLEKALRHGTQASDQQILQMKKKLIQLGLEAAKTLHRSYHSIREVGMDVAIDQQLNIWILEINTRPHYQLFKSHQNKQLYQKIDRQIRFIRKHY